MPCNAPFARLPPPVAPKQSGVENVGRETRVSRLAQGDALPRTGAGASTPLGRSQALLNNAAQVSAEASPILSSFAEDAAASSQATNRQPLRACRDAQPRNPANGALATSVPTSGLPKDPWDVAFGTSHMFTLPRHPQRSPAGARQTGETPATGYCPTTFVPGSRGR